MTYSVNFEITNQGGNLFHHWERFVVAGLARVRVREQKSRLWTDWSGEVRSYRATSSQPFVVCVISDHAVANQDGTMTDLSDVVSHPAVAAFAATDAA
jgi:hypothetical protein